VIITLSLYPVFRKDAVSEMVANSKIHYYIVIGLALLIILCCILPVNASETTILKNNVTNASSSPEKGGLSTVERTVQENIPVNLTSDQFRNVVPPTEIPYARSTYTPRTIYSPRTDSEMYVENIHDFLTYWNQQLNWGFSSTEIDSYSLSMEQGVLKKYLTTPGSHGLHVQNDRLFYLEVGDALGFSKAQSEALVRDIDAQDLKNWQTGVGETNLAISHTSAPSIPPGLLVTSPVGDSHSENITKKSAEPFHDILLTWNGFLNKVAVLLRGP